MRFPKTSVALMTTLALVSCSPAYADVIGILGGHYSKHLLSEDVTNEKHAWVSLRYNWFTIGRFNNSYKQPGFSGESYHIGMVYDFSVWENVGGSTGGVVLKASAGIMRGYTRFGGHEFGGNKEVHGYAAGGPFYQQPLGNGFEVEGGVMVLGDAAVPSAGMLYRF